MQRFEPDYRNILDAASNRKPRRLPLYEHGVDVSVMEQVLGIKFLDGLYGGYEEKKEFFRHYCDFFYQMGYDTVTFEQCIGPAMPGSGSLGGHVPGVIKNREDFEKYPWESIPDRYFALYAENFRALAEVIPAGMRAIGGVGNGIFECVQDVTGYMALCYIREDDPGLYAALFQRVGKVNLAIWKRFLKEFSDLFCVCRFGDDLGYKSSTLLPADDIRENIFPQYAPIVEEIHRAGKRFLLHSCGCIFDVMEELINVVKIDAKHSNEDQIAPFPVWVERYGDRIGNFGGIDTDAVCRLDRVQMKEYILDVIRQCEGHGGFAFGSGNSIPAYVPAENYVNMVEIVREYRGE